MRKRLLSLQFKSSHSLSLSLINLIKLKNISRREISLLLMKYLFYVQCKTGTNSESLKILPIHTLISSWSCRFLLFFFLLINFDHLLPYQCQILFTYQLLRNSSSSFRAHYHLFTVLLKISEILFANWHALGVKITFREDLKELIRADSAVNNSQLKNPSSWVDLQESNLSGLQGS